MWGAPEPSCPLGHQNHKQNTHFSPSGGSEQGGPSTEQKKRIFARLSRRSSWTSPSCVSITNVFSQFCLVFIFFKTKFALHSPIFMLLLWNRYQPIMAVGGPVGANPCFSEHNSVLEIIHGGNQSGWEVCELETNGPRVQPEPSFTNLTSYFLICKIGKWMPTTLCCEE